MKLIKSMNFGPSVPKGIMPIWILIFIAYLLGSILLRDFPEQCGA